MKSWDELRPQKLLSQFAISRFNMWPFTSISDLDKPDFSKELESLTQAGIQKGRCEMLVDILIIANQEINATEDVLLRVELAKFIVKLSKQLKLTIK